MTTPRTPRAFSGALAFTKTLAARSPLRLRPFLFGFGLLATLQACAAVSVVGTAASVATSAATTAVSAGAAAAGAGVSATATAVEAVIP